MDNPYFSPDQEAEFDSLCRDIGRLLRDQTGKVFSSGLISRELMQRGGYQPNEVIGLAVLVYTDANNMSWFADRLVSVQRSDQRVVDNDDLRWL